MKINSLWIGNELSLMEILSIKSHLKQGHEYHLWTYDLIKNIPSDVIIERGQEILHASEIFSYKTGEGKGSYSAFSNLFRYKLLLERGGWWSDTDVVALKPFDFKDDFVFASERSLNGFSSPTTCVIKLPANSEIAKYCYTYASQIDRNTLDWGTIGPKLLTKAIFLHKLDKFVESPTCFCPINWFDAQQDPPMHRDVNLDCSHAVHLWHEMWRRKSINKNEFHSNTLYGKLLKEFCNDVL